MRGGGALFSQQGAESLHRNLLPLSASVTYAHALVATLRDLLCFPESNFHPNKQLPLK